MDSVATRTVKERTAIAVMGGNHIPDRSWKGPTRAQVAVWCGLLVLAVFLSVRDYQAYQFGAHFDDARYVILAQSLLRSDDYGMINAPGEPGTPWYPFGYPLILAPLVLLFPNSLNALKLPSLLATLLNATLLFWGWHWLSRRSYWWSTAVVGLCIVSPLAIDHSRRVMSEPLFTTFGLVAIVLAEQAVREREMRGWPALMGTVLTFAVFTRTIGIVLLTSVCLFLVRAKGKTFWKQGIQALTVAVMLVSLIVGVTSVGSRDLLPTKYLGLADASMLASLGNLAAPQSADTSDSQSDSLGDQTAPAGRGSDAQSLLTGLWWGLRLHLAEDVRSALLPLGGGAREQAFAARLGIPSLPLVVGSLVFMLVVIGTCRWFVEEGPSAFRLFAVLYFAALFLWIWRGPRLLYPIQPQLQYTFLLGIETVAVWVATIRRRTDGSRQFADRVLVSVAALLLAVSVYKSLTLEDSRLHTGDVEARSSWLTSNTPVDAVVMTEAPEIDFVYAGRHTVAYPLLSSSAEELGEYLVMNGVDYVLVAPVVSWDVPRYNRRLSPGAVRVLDLLAELSATGRVARVYASEQQMIEIFSVLSS